MNIFCEYYLNKEWIAESNPFFILVYSEKVQYNGYGYQSKGER